MTLRAFIIEDEKLVAWSLSKYLEKLDFETQTFEYGKEGVRQALDNPPDLLFVDYRLPDLTGIEVLSELQLIRDKCKFFFMTAYGTQDVADGAKNLGAIEYFNKPLNFKDIQHHISQSFENRHFLPQKDIGKDTHDNIIKVGEYVTRCDNMKRILETVQKLVMVDAGTILLLGETGTGKDTLGRVIHEHSPRKNKPFVIVNCASLQETLLESELFGYEKGAFTDAKSRKIGQLELADGGTVYLDEIGEIPINFQAKLLRFIETQTFYRIGGTQEHKVNVRIIASTNRDLRTEMVNGNFREDLFFRLNVITLLLPPLRDRVNDITLLVDIFIKQFNKQFNMTVSGITDHAQEMLTKYNWPGNVRELRNTIERIYLLENPDQLEAWHFPLEIQQNSIITDKNVAKKEPQNGDAAAFFHNMSLDEMEEFMLQWALEIENGNQTHAASRLKITRDQMRYKMKKYQLL